jgi:RNA-directed DNA polymerase
LKSLDPTTFCGKTARPQDRQFLGFSFTSGRRLKIKASAKALENVKHRVRKINRRSRGISLLQVIKELNAYLSGWLGYYKLVETPTTFRDLDSWIRRRLRCFMVKQLINNCHT